MTAPITIRGKGPSQDEEKTVSPPNSYSPNGEVTKKMRKQLERALKDPEGQRRCELVPFTVEVPKGLPEKSRDVLPMDSAVAQHQGSGLSWPDHYLLRSEVNFILRGEIKTGLLFGVFDGHYDKGRAGDFLKTDLTAALEKIFTESEDSDGANEDVVTDALSRLFLDVSESYRKADGKGGASVTSIFVLDDQVYCANAGDCRTILVRAKDTKQLSEDASLRNPHFQKWHANQQNDIVNWCGKFEVHKSEVRLNIARDVGAFEWMCHRPKITSVCIADQPDDIENGKVYCTSGDFLVLGSDGLSEPATVEEVGAAVRKLANAGASPQVIADVIAKKAGSYPGNDYVTVLVIPI